MKQVNLGMIGGGTVGSGVFHALQTNGKLLSSRIGIPVKIHKVAVKAEASALHAEVPCKRSILCRCATQSEFDRAALSARLIQAPGPAGPATRVTGTASSPISSGARIERS